MSATNQLPYDKTNPISIFNYSKGLIGRTLREFIQTGYTPKKARVA